MTLDDRLEALRRDRTHGALDLALIGIDLARDWRVDGRPPGEIVAALRKMHPAIATLGNLAAAIEADEDLAKLRERLVEGNTRIAAKLRRLIPAGRAIATISNSSTVREALAVLEPRLVVVFESLPGGEGRALADALEGLNVRVEPDAAMGKVAEEADCGLVGIDSFDESGALVHKVGTLPLALSLDRMGKPFYAAGHSFKRLPRQIEYQPNDPLFDRTPPELVTIVTEQEPGS